MDKLMNKVAQAGAEAGARASMNPFYKAKPDGKPKDKGNKGNRRKKVDVDTGLIGREPKLTIIATCTNIKSQKTWIRTISPHIAMTDDTAKELIHCIEPLADNVQMTITR
jgi:hypothetical protein